MPQVWIWLSSASSSSSNCPQLTVCRRWAISLTWVIVAMHWSRITAHKEGVDKWVQTELTFILRDKWEGHRATYCKRGAYCKTQQWIQSWEIWHEMTITDSGPITWNKAESILEFLPSQQASIFHIVSGNNPLRLASSDVEAKLSLSAFHNKSFDCKHSTDMQHVCMSKRSPISPLSWLWKPARDLYPLLCPPQSSLPLCES